MDDETEALARFGYKQELRRVLHRFDAFGIAFCFLSPVVGVYALFVLGLGTGGPRYLWLMPIVVFGQLLVALVLAELGSMYPIAGALFQWAKNLMGSGYGWWVGWFYGWALIVVVAAVDSGVALYATPLLNRWFGWQFDPANANTVLWFTMTALAFQTLFNMVGVRYVAMISRMGVWVEVVGTFGVALLLLIAGFHHGVPYTFTTQGVEYGALNPLGVDFHGSWLAAALVAILAHVWIFGGFESAGDVAEEVVDAQTHVPRAIIRTILLGGITSFILVLALILAIPPGHEAFLTAASFSGGVPFIISSNIAAGWLQDTILLLVLFAFFSCGTAVQATGARVIFSYARDGALPGAGTLRKVSPRFRTPVNALWVVAIVPTLFILLAHVNPTSPVHILFFTWPASINALLLLVSFGVSAGFLTYTLVVLASLIARIRGWRPTGPFQLGAWAYPVTIAAVGWTGLMLVNILAPTGTTSGRGALFNYDWMTLLVLVVIAAVGATYYLVSKPQDRIAGRVIQLPETEGVGSGRETKTTP